jgi:hypothetical protein
MIYELRHLHVVGVLIIQRPTLQVWHKWDDLWSYIYIYIYITHTATTSFVVSHAALVASTGRASRGVGRSRCSARFGRQGGWNGLFYGIPLSSEALVIIK